MTERKLARIVALDDVMTHPNADALELAIVGGWQCVVKKGAFVKGDLAVYIEVDAAVPLDNELFAFLEGRNNVTLDEKRYARIKTIKLRKEISQGLVIPCNVIKAPEGADVTDLLGIVKYEKPEERERNSIGNKVKSGSTALGFPKFIPKTDQTRVQNITKMYEKSVADGERFEKTYKLDGSSLTIWVKDGVVGVASRNVGFRMEDESIGFFSAVKNLFKGQGWVRTIKADNNQFTQAAEEAGVVRELREYHARTKKNIAIQGELVGPSIQQNFEGMEKNQFFVYDVFDIDTQTYMLPMARRTLIHEFGLKHVPVASDTVLLPTVAESIADADGPSGLNGKYREGFVYKSLSRDFSFKVISNRYLIDED